MKTPGHSIVGLSTSSVTPDIMLPAFQTSLEDVLQARCLAHL